MKRSWVTQIRGVEPGEASLNFRRPYSVEQADKLRAVRAVSPECTCGSVMMANEDGTWSCLNLRCGYYCEPFTRNEIDNRIEDAGMRAWARASQ